MNASQKKFVAEYDAERVLNAHHQSVFDGMLRGSGWTKSDGPIPGVFASRPAGHRALWTCRWAVGFSTHLLSPDDWCPIEDMTFSMLLAELGDVLYVSNDTRAAAAGRLLHEWAEGTPTMEFWLRRVKDLLAAARQQLPEYSCLWDLPGRNLVRISVRPGWSEQTDRQIAKRWAAEGGRER